ncbi:MAG: hypothetical protein QGG42_16620 [Phycisphaerae bacterium]|nr:hypothetical protein [Phycisphaerae bacterium]
MNEHQERVDSIAIANTAGLVITGSFDTDVKVWSLAQEAVERDLSGHICGVNYVAVSDDGSRVVSASDCGPLRLWNPRDGSVLGVFLSDPGPYPVVSVTADGAHALTCFACSELCIWDLSTLRVVRSFDVAQFHSCSADMTASGKRAVLGGLDGPVRVLDLDSGNLLHTLERHGGEVRHVAITQDGTIAASAAEDGVLCVWDLHRGVKLTEFSAELGYKSGAPIALKNGLVVSDDGSIVATINNDRSLTAWRVRPPCGAVTVRGDHPFVCCAVSSDGQLLLVGDAAGGVHFLHTTDPAPKGN